GRDLPAPAPTAAAPVVAVLEPPGRRAAAWIWSFVGLAALIAVYLIASAIGPPWIQSYGPRSVAAQAEAAWRRFKGYEASDPIPGMSRGRMPEEKSTNLQRGLFLYNRDAFRDAFTSDDPEAEATLLDFLKQNDPSFHGSILSIFSGSPPPDWCLAALPRLRRILDSGLDGSPRRALETCLMRMAQPEDLPRVRKLAEEASPEFRLDALGALARLGEPAPVSALAKMHRESGADDVRLGYVRLAIRHYSTAEADGFLRAALFEANGEPRGALFDVAVTSGDPPWDGANRTHLNAQALVRMAFHWALGAEGHDADVALMKSAMAAARLWQTSPAETAARLTPEPGESKRFQRRLVETLLERSGQFARVEPAWRIPDGWYSMAVRWHGGSSSSFLKDLLEGAVSPVASGRDVDRQSRMLALVDVPTESGRARLATELGAAIAAGGEGMEAENPLLLHAMVMTLAATGAPEAATMLERFLGKTAIDRDPLYWDAFVTGAAMRPAAIEPLLRRASRHPLLTIRMRAQDSLAAAAGDARTLRNGLDSTPEAPPEVTAIAGQLQHAATQDDAQLVFSRQRSLLAADLALAITDSAGAIALLESRIERGDRLNALAQWLLAANQPGPLDQRRYDGMLRTGANHNIYEPATMLAFAAHDHHGQLDAIRWQATGAHFGRSTPPLLHRATALFALSRLERKKASAQQIDDFLGVAENDASAFVRVHAAIAAVRAVQAGDAPRIAARLERSPRLDPEVKAALRLAAGKLE
ncbi:MAG TPA: hypothetical protein VNC50_16540, partial [Planctomycetia bacterium]|nr:hypothetical protein [Planctomycetia bacterium]